jgi:hypothetical protein
MRSAIRRSEMSQAATSLPVAGVTVRLIAGEQLACRPATRLILAIDECQASPSGERSKMRPSSQRRWSKVTGLTQVLPSASAIPSRCRTRDALGPMLMPGTDLAERTRLLIDLHVKSSAQQRRSHSKAANAATYDCDRERQFCAPSRSRWRPARAWPLPPNDYRESEPTIVPPLPSEGP